ncbi:glycosyltransferase [Mangrovimonas sp. AS39]|uniref:glycosyltransferase n=1 Tax=Mangrovimonas futianensis TaxID=2895523 RepID=UPI001E2F44D6|nr:glycosyltransferase [Mangrovimonas futianensis]MCF1190814.1 glycosyltransferase [Mangrovimonas futianensis]MCF1194511.1 glycosyltransferase [Mangrovimonas futianensis]
MAILLVQAGLSNFSGSFIKAHEELIDSEKVILRGAYHDLRHNDRQIKLFYSANPLLFKLKKLLPQFLYHKYVTKKLEAFEGRHDAIEGLVKKFKVKLIFAEFGHNGAALAPHAKKLGLPLIVHFHGHDAHRTDFIKPKLQEYKNMFAYATKIVSVSHFMTNALLELGAPKEKIVYNPYGPRPFFYDNQPNYGNTIFYVGRFTDIKSPVLILDAFRELVKKYPEAKLVMVGMGELLENCKALVRAWGLNDKITFTGGIPHEELMPYFQNACMFVQHSVQPSYGDAEGTPNTILEASAAALPVVSTRHAGIPQAVLHEETGFLVDEYDTKGMSEYMIKLFKDKDLCKKMGEAGRNHIKRNYNINRHIGVLNKIIKEAV